MKFKASHVVPAPRNEVWAWHTRPGALSRLTPPFVPMTPIQQADKLADGTTILVFPAGLRWTARHDLSRYRKGFSFSDVCVNAPMRILANWRHDHLFEDHAEGTKVVDLIDARVPRSMLESMMAYRQQQLIGDFASLNRIKEYGHSTEAADGGLIFGSPQPLTIAITGSRGTVGRALAAQLTTAGHTVVQLVREKAKPSQRLWEPHSPAPDLLEGIDVLVHLAGEPVFGRFNESHKNDIRASRITPTRKLAELVACTAGVRTMISASAIGYYGNDRGDELLPESSEPGDGFFADVTVGWEAATLPAREAGKRVVHMRTGVVISGNSGVLPVFKTLISTGLGGSWGDGEFWLSWISLDDLTDIFAHAIFDKRLSGPLNAVAPNPVLNREWAKAIASELKRPASIPLPTFGPALLLGKEGARELVFA
ncbi:MAG: TIGR01777 family oxidoreductase, partial [Corynebacterium sp.]|nr:TIGR01777 family oxidoreductase [Corynebacterium sp.]